MFPRSFKATADQRLALWGFLLGILACLYVGTELISASRLADYSRELAGYIAVGRQLPDTMPAYARLDSAFAAHGAAEPTDTDIDALAQSTRNIAAKLTGDGRDKALEIVRLLQQMHLLLPTDEALAHKTFLMVGREVAALGTAVSEAQAGVSGNLTYHLENARQNKLLLGLLGLFGAVLIVSLEYRWVLRPVVGMARMLDAAQPDHRWIGKIAMRRDEIGMLGRALHQHLESGRARQDEAAARLDVLSEQVARQQVRQAQALAFQSQIATIAAVLERHAERMSDASAAFTQTSEQVGARAGEAANATQRASRHVGEMADGISDVSRLVTTAASEARRMFTIADGAKDMVGEATRDTAALRHAVEAIERIIDIIGAVANQTNLLALNATIEAARAGESGRGFAVVASEVKQLAHRTAQATDEVRGGLASMAVAAERITTRVGALVTSVDEVERAANSIAELTCRQDARGAEIGEGTSRTSADVRAVADQVEQVAGMVENWRQTAETVTLASRDLGHQAQELRDAVDAFIIDNERVSA